jgi:hypothetical protein
VLSLGFGRVVLESANFQLSTNFSLVLKPRFCQVYVERWIYFFRKYIIKILALFFKGHALDLKADLLVNAAHITDCAVSHPIGCRVNKFTYKFPSILSAISWVLYK